MFWGLIMEPNKRYTQIVEKPFHISQAAMDISTGDNDPCQVMVVVDGKNFLVCTLQKNKTIQVPLDLYFKSGDSIAFLTNGKCNVHLTGYLDPELDDEDDEEEEDEEDEEVPVLTASKKKRKLDSSDASSSKKAKLSKKDVSEDSSDDDDDDDDDEESDEDHLQKLLDGESVDTDENDESFNVNTTSELDESDEEDSDEEEEDMDDADVSKSEVETTLETSKDESKIDMSKLSKSQKRRLKKKQQKEKSQVNEPKVNGVDKSKKEKQEQKPKNKQDEKQQKDKKKEKEVKKPQDAKAGGEKKEKKTISGGVFIEDLKVGDGPVAKPGQSVVVYYEGRLKQNNKVFDSTLKGPGFKFRLGAKEVIAGWDAAISGMKVGGKRKIICPPAMAYGAKGSPPVIPPNSTLVFEVELKNVNIDVLLCGH